MTFWFRELENFELSDFGVRPWFVTRSMSCWRRVIYLSSVSTNSHILKRSDSSCSTECFGSDAVLTFRPPGVDTEGDRFAWPLGTLLDGVKALLIRLILWLLESCGRKDGLVFLIEARGLSGV